MKKFASLALVILMLLMTMAVPAVAETVTALDSDTDGMCNVPFSEGYYGYCLDATMHGAKPGEQYQIAESTSAATNNDDGSDISRTLKSLFTKYFETLFVSDGNGGYIIDPDKEDGFLPNIIYYLTGDYGWINDVDGRNVYNDIIDDDTFIDDHGYTKTLDNGDVITFDFLVLEPIGDDASGRQTFFAYKLTVNGQSDGGDPITPSAPTEYTVTLDPNGGNDTVHSSTVASGTEITLNPFEFTREGYAFTGWNTKPDGSGTSYGTDAEIPVTESITLYAQWEKITPDNTGNPPLFPDNTDNPPLFPDSSDNPPSLPGGGEIEWPSESVPAIPETGDASTPLLWAGLLLLSLCGVVCMRRKAVSR